MKINSYVIAGLCLWSLIGLTACGENTDNGGETEQTQDSSDQNTPNDSTPDENTPTGDDNITKTGSLQGSVQSELTSLNTCLVYLYDQNVTVFADQFDPSHADYVPPSITILGSAPLASSSITESGTYQFLNIDVGQYQLVLNCIDTEGVQDESSLTDDPIQFNGFTIPNPNAITPNTFSVSVSENNTTEQDFIDNREKPKIDNTASVVIYADATDEARVKAPLYDMWKTANRIAPKLGVSTLPGMQINTIRMIGGINKTVDGQKVPNLDYDPVRYNEDTQQYEYDFTPLIGRIDAVVKQGYVLHQIVVDQPPWAFQRGYTFIPDSEPFDGVNFKESQRVSHYGNSLPPKDKVAYNQFLQAMMQHLIQEYGRDTVAKWRFRIGTEIETPDHWYGTEQDFIEHFANSAKAIRAVLPEAIIGVHTRGPDFLYKNGTVTNYKGEQIKAFSDGIIEYSHDNNIKIDFWGVSDYPFINLESTRDPKTKYAKFFKPMLEHPKWQNGTAVDVEEFSVITRMGGVPNTNVAFISSHSPQAETFSVALTDEFYQHGVDGIFLWGYRTGSSRPLYMTIFESMFDLPRVSSEITNQEGGAVENIGAVVVKNEQDKSIQAVTYHYDPASLEADNVRDVQLAVVTEAPVGTTYYYRKKLAAPEHHAFYSFMNNASASSWLRTDKNYFSKYGSPTVDLNDAGKAEWDKYTHDNPSVWTEWQEGITVAREDGQPGSLLKVNSALPQFSYEKTEIKWVVQREGSVLVGWDDWRLPPNQATLENGAVQGVMDASVGTWKNHVNAGSSDGTFGSLSKTISNASEAHGSSGGATTGFRSDKSTEVRSLDFTLTSIAESDIRLGQFHFDIISRGGAVESAWTLEVLDGGAITKGVVGTGDIPESWDANFLADIDVNLADLADAILEQDNQVTFRLSLFSSNPSKERDIDIDNVAISSQGVVEGNQI